MEWVGLVVNHIIMAFALLGSSCLILLLSFTSGYSEYHERKDLSVLLVHSMFSSHIFPLVSLGAELVSRGHTVSCIGSVVEGFDHIPALAESYGIKYKHISYVSKEIYDGFKQTGKHDGDKSWVTLIANLTRFMLKAQKDAESMLLPFKTLNISEYDYIIVEQAAYPIQHYLSNTRKATNTMFLIILAEFTPRFIIPWPYPRLSAPLTPDMSFIDRLINTALYIPVEYAMMVMISIMTNAIDSDLNVPINFLNAALGQPILYNTVIGFEWPKPLLPLQHYVGPMFPPNPSPLDSSLSEWLNESGVSPVIVISMGTTAIITRELAESFITLSTKYRLVWSLRESNQHVLSGLHIDKERIYLTSWLSQFTMLQHPSVKVAILHCGINGVQEALYNRVPVLCVPFGMDQHNIALQITHQKLGLSLKSHEVNEKTLTDAIDLLQGSLYQNNAKRISHLYKAAGGAKAGADLVELYAAYGYEHGLPAFIRYKWSFIEYYNIDVWIVLIGMLIALMYGIRKCCRFCCTRRCSSLKTKSKKE